jgi:L-idonate 5-dehydrogenase
LREEEQTRPRDGLDVTPLITHRFPLDQAAAALAVAADGSSGSSSSKVMLQLDASRDAS